MSPQRAPPTAPMLDGLPEGWVGLVAEAACRGYLELESNESRIRYNCAEVRECSYANPEERVRAGVYAWLIIDQGYAPEAIKVEARVPRRTPSDYADVVVYTNAECRVPYLVVETKAPNQSEAAFRQAVEQAFGNANSLRDTNFALVDSGDRSQLFEVAGHPHDEREANRLGDRDNLPASYGTVSAFRLVAGDSEHDIKPCSATQVETLVRRVHGLIWAGGKRDPFSAFDEWCKMLFAKMYDERHTATGTPRRFQVGRGESDVSVANRVRRLYVEARAQDESIFASDLLLPDNKVAQVVREIQQVAFAQTDVDTLGTAFEGFFGSAFRGELGQYFTRREICRFVCALLEPTERDRVLDPTCGSGGFLLETLIQVWRYIDDAFVGQSLGRQRKYDFAWQNLFGIEIHSTLGRICQTNLLIHKDGHTNVEVGRSCLDSVFDNKTLDPDRPSFTVIVGNPPFGDKVRKGDADQLGNNRLSAFELAGDNHATSEVVILERSIKWLAPGHGRLGVVVPDGVLNNASETSKCPALRRFLFRNTQILAIVSLPDHAFRRSGAQNKTSLLFVRRWSESERKKMEEAVARHLGNAQVSPGKGRDAAALNQAIGSALRDVDYRVFLAEADEIGYTPTGVSTARNDLYSGSGFDVEESEDTILGQYKLFRDRPHSYGTCIRPVCTSLSASELFAGHPSHRIDAKYFTFKSTENVVRDAGVHRLGELVSRCRESIVPNDWPEREFKTITLTLEGDMRPREAGKGRNPSGWHGSYFPAGQRWFVVRKGDIVVSRIDLWKGCTGVASAAFDGAIVTGEFPVYRVRPEHTGLVDGRYLQLLLRSQYFRRAIRAVTTGHSNRRRTQESDFLGLLVPLPPLDDQVRIADAMDGVKRRRDKASADLLRRLDAFDRAVEGLFTPQALREIAGSPQ